MKYYLVAAIVASCLAVSLGEIEQQRVIETAYELLARASSTSEVLALNLTNAFILGGLVLLLGGLGVIPFLFGGTGFGGFGGFGGGGGGYYRSSDGGNQVSSFGEADLVGGMCFIMYTSGNMDKLSCMKRTACEDPNTASKYLAAGKLWHKMHKMME